MKRVAVVVAVLLMAGVWVLAAGPVQKPRILMARGDLYIWLADAGSATCIGGQPTFTFPPCSPGTTQIIWRNFVGTFTPANVIGHGRWYLGGTFLSPGACNLDAQYRGYCWGTFQGPGAGGGTWEGIWYGSIDFGAFGGDLTFIGYGSGSPQMEGM